MEKKKTLLEQFINEQVIKIDNKRKEMADSGTPFLPVIAFSTSPGSLGSKMAQIIASELGFDFYHREIIKEVAKSADISPSLVEGIEKERFSGVEDFIASLVRKNYIWPGLYLEHIKRVVNAIGDKGHGVIVGRGAGFILPPKKRLSVRTVAPFEKRKENIMREFDATESQAEERIRTREGRRKDYIKKSFNADIDDPVMYDMVINTGDMSIEACAEAVKLFYSKKFSIS